MARMGRRIKHQTPFSLWRQQVGLTISQAADLLDVSASTIANWNAGVSTSTGAPSAPDEAHRRLMTAYAAKAMPEMWPV